MIANPGEKRNRFWPESGAAGRTELSSRAAPESEGRKELSNG